jgi:DNA-binding response OmpR family regulator/anti-sigma regulatory factor (Ser/Thr protein kinase)
MNILIIEDEISIRQTLQDLLELNGHTVLVAENGRIGIQLAERQPDLILCDVGMPDLDGYQVIDAIRQMPACCDIPFIFLTARASRQDQRHGMALGADDYITKPFTESEIVTAIEARLRRQKPLRERVEKLLAERLFVAGAKWSHELMTPLNGVLGGLELIESEADTIAPGELKVLLGLIRASAERQHALSRKLMFHYELQGKNGSGASRKVFRCDAPTAIASGANGPARNEKRPADLAVHCEPGEVAILDGFLISAVAEVVENALRFSKLGQPVTVVGACHADRYRIEIIDQGFGMTPEECASIAPFTQFERSKFERQGLGLGLSIARAVAESVGGQLTVQPGPGKCGVHVSFDLPRV